MVVGTGMSGHWNAAGYQDGDGYWDWWTPRCCWALGWVGPRVMAGTQTMVAPPQVGTRVDAGTGTSGHQDWWALGGRQRALGQQAQRPQGRCQGSPRKGDALGHPSHPSPTWVPAAHLLHPVQPQLAEPRYPPTPPGRSQPLASARATPSPTASHALQASPRQVGASPWPRALPCLFLPTLGGCQQVGRVGRLRFP